VRAAEYGIPVFRLSPTGISQVVDRTGAVQASAPFPGELATISGVLELRQPGTLPLDRWLAPFSVFVTALVICGLMLVSINRSFKS
jgi:apolipoprotein N-acyltransferase